MAVQDPPQPQPAIRPTPNYGRLDVRQSLRRSIGIAVLPVIVLVGAAVAIGLARSPEYTSEARLNVGGLNLTQQSIPGYTTAVQQLAVAYSRAIDATRVVGPVARKTHLTRKEVADQVSATPIQGSPVIRIRGTADRPGQARRLADAAAQSLVRYAVELNSGASQSRGLLRRFVTASRDFRRATLSAARLKPGDPRRRAANVREDIARLKMQTAGALYQQSLAGQATTSLVQKLAPAAPATDDRASVLERLIAGGLIAGLLVGVGLAVARSNRVAARRLGAA